MQFNDESLMGACTAAAKRPTPRNGWELDAAHRVVEHARHELAMLEASTADSASIAFAVRRYGVALDHARRIERALRDQHMRN